MACPFFITPFVNSAFFCSVGFLMGGTLVVPLAAGVAAADVGLLIGAGLLAKGLAAAEAAAVDEVVFKPGLLAGVDA